MGVDPSSVATGWAVLDGDSRKARVVSSDTIRPSSRLKLSERLHVIHEHLANAIAQHDPAVMVIESAFLHRNVKTAFALGQVRGVVLLAAVQQGVAQEEYSAPEIKRAACGYGAAGKDQVATMMARILGLAEVPGDDEADAMATAWCHLNHAARPGRRSEAATFARAPAAKRRRL
ncbi:MAG TPA: crossover junction endodeoxyribonuclease RuvC [bacterium]|nr:crossover junction endodeoxyribonuclease RuvC [bacterium]